MSVAILPSSSGRTQSGVEPSQVLQRWRRQIAGRHELAERRGVRPFALVGYRIRGDSAEQLVPLDRLSFIALFDERDDDDHLATRLVGVRARVVGTKLVVGGPDNTLFDKDVRSAPCSSHGRRLDPCDAELCELALSWEKYIERVNRHPHYPRRSALRWPTWWCDVAGPPVDITVRRHGDRTLIALETALSRSLPIARVFADVSGVPKRQVLAGANLRRLLCGTAGPIMFDLFHTRFRRAA